MKVYGIVNCNTVEAARARGEGPRAQHGDRAWRVAAAADARWFVGHRTFKEAAARSCKELLARWCAAFGWENVVNRRGTTWRLLPPAAQARVKDEKSAIALMLEKPTVIKRPVVETGKMLLSGFDEAEYAKKL